MHRDKLEIPSNTHVSLSAQAAAWVSYIYSGEATREGQNAFSHWLQRSPQHRLAFRQADAAWRDLDIAIISDETFDHETQTYAQSSLTPSKGAGHPRDSQFPPHNGRRNKRAIGAFAIAACLLLAVFNAPVLWRTLAPSPAPTQMHYATGAHELKTVHLPDGSTAVLAPKTRLEFSYSPTARAAAISKGRASFDVERDENRVFSVIAGATEISVLGTEFDVQSHASGVKISVLEGAVKVAPRAPQQSQTAPLQPIVLKAGDMVTADLTGQLSAIGESEIEHLNAWRNGLLVFQEKPLNELIEEVNLYREKPIIIADEAIGATPVTMTLPIDNSDLLISALSISEAIQAIEDTNAVKLYAGPNKAQ